MIRKFRKKPVIIEAAQWDGTMGRHKFQRTIGMGRAS